MKSTMPCKKGDIEFITWLDAVGDSTRTQVDSLSGITLATNTNLGWVVHEDSVRIVLAHGVSSTGEVDHFVIPKNCVVSRVRVIGKPPESKRMEAQHRPAK